MGVNASKRPQTDHMLAHIYDLFYRGVLVPISEGKCVTGVIIAGLLYVVAIVLAWQVILLPHPVAKGIDMSERKLFDEGNE